MLTSRLRARVRAAWSLPFTVLVGVVGWNAWSMRPELLRVSSLNDGTFQLAYLQWATDRLRAGRSPTDGLFTQLGLGFPIFHHYQVAPHLLAAPVALLFGAENTFRWAQFLLLVTWPLGVFWAARQFGFSRWAASVAAIASPFLVSLNGYGFERGSYLWRGYGMWTQVFGMWFMPLALGAAWRALRERRSLWLPAVLLALTLCSHVLTGYLTLMIVVVFGLTAPLVIRGDGVAGWARARSVVFARAVGMALMASALSAWMLLPALRDQAWTRNSLPAASWWTDSYGAHKVLVWLVDGGLFDHGRKPIVTVFVIAGLLVAVARCRKDLAARAALSVFGASLILYFGRPTLGPLIDLLPVHHELFLHRMVVGVHLGGLLLAGYGAEQLVLLVLAAYRTSRDAWAATQVEAEPTGETEAGPATEAEPAPTTGIAPTGETLVSARHGDGMSPGEAYLVGAGAAVLAIVFVLCLWPLLHQARSTDALEGVWINQQRQNDATEGKDLSALLRHTDGNRVYAGPQGNGSYSFRLDYVPGPLALLDHGAMGVGFGGRVPAITEPTESAFDPNNEAEYELFDVRWLILPATYTPPSFARPAASSGSLHLYRIATDGWAQLVDTDRVIPTSTLNIAKDSAAFVAGSGALEHRYPLLALNGKAPGTPTLLGSSGTSAAAPGGSISHVDARLDDGVVRATVDLTRRQVVVVPVSFHPRWQVRIDGKLAPTQVVAPGLLAVTVGPGHHVVEFRYDPVPFSETAALLLLGLLACALAVFVDGRFVRRRRVGSAELRGRDDAGEDARQRPADPPPAG